MQAVSATNPALDTYYSALANYAALGVTQEQGLRPAFRSLLETFAKSAEPSGWTLVEEHTLLGSRKRPRVSLFEFSLGSQGRLLRQITIPLPRGTGLWRVPALSADGARLAWLSPSRRDCPRRMLVGPRPLGAGRCVTG